MIAEKENDAWKVIHAELIPPYHEKESTALRPTRLRVYGDTLYILVKNEYHDIPDIPGNTAAIYRYDLEKHCYLDTIEFPNEHRINDFVLSVNQELIALTDTGIEKFDGAFQVLKSLDAPYNELEWMDETTLCIGSSSHNQAPQNKLITYNLQKKEYSVLYEGNLFISDIAIDQDQSVIVTAQHQGDQYFQLYCYKQGHLSLYEPNQRLSVYTKVLINHDGNTPITIHPLCWTNPILYYRRNESVYPTSMQFVRPKGLKLQFPTCLHANADETSVLVDQGINIFTDSNPYPFASQWKDTNLKIPYEICSDIIQVSPKKYLILTDTEFCIVQPHDIKFSPSYKSKFDFKNFLLYQGKYYIWCVNKNNKNQSSLIKIDLEFCTLDSNPVIDLPQGLISVHDDILYVYHEEKITKGFLQDNVFFQIDLFSAPSVYWDSFSCDKFIYNPDNSTFILIDTSNKRVRATYLKYNNLNEPYPLGLIHYQNISPNQGTISISIPSLLNGRVAFLTNEMYGRLLEF
jgi:hypothetical protein